MANNDRPTTSTQIRNMYSDGMSYLNITFFNMNLCFKFYPFLGKDNMGRSTYDMKNGQSTTVNIEGAYALYMAASDIIEDKCKNSNTTVECAGGAMLNLDYKTINNQPEVVFSISKNNQTVSFKFNVIQQTITDHNGKTMVKPVHVGLGAFMKTIDGYLTGINADRHLNKMTEDYVKSLDDQGGQNSGNTSQGNNRPNFRNNGYQNQGYKKPNYNNNKGGYNRNFNNNQNQNKGNWQPPNNNQQDFGSYEINN